MVTILTSSPTREITPDCPLPALDESSGFVECLRGRWPEEGRCLMIAAFPSAHDRNDEMTDFYCRAVKNAGLPVGCFDLWDDRLPPLTQGALHSYGAIFLAGGHVATEAAWFRAIGLRELLAGYPGLVVGTSAGSMNCAREVYAWPEEPGESLLPMERLFFPGLGLAKTLVLPHFQKLRDSWLDGRRLMEDITCGHSHGRAFLAIPDGSYVVAENGTETVHGEAWLVADGIISPFCVRGEERGLHPGRRHTSEEKRT